MLNEFHDPRNVRRGAVESITTVTLPGFQWIQMADGVSHCQRLFSWQYGLRHRYRGSERPDDNCSHATLGHAVTAEIQYLFGEVVSRLLHDA